MNELMYKVKRKLLHLIGSGWGYSGDYQNWNHPTFTRYDDPIIFQRTQKAFEMVKANNALYVRDSTPVRTREYNTTLTNILDRISREREREREDCPARFWRRNGNCVLSKQRTATFNGLEYC